MNVREYKSNIVAQYSNEQQGSMMYRHHKLFDISKAIYEWLNIDLDNEKLLYAHIDTVLHKLPEEYTQKYQINFVKDMYGKGKTLDDVYKYSNKFAYFFTSLRGKNRARLLQVLELLPQYSNIVITDKDIKVTHYKGIHVLLIRDDIYNHISKALGFYKTHKDTIVLPFSYTEETLEHEYQHAVNNRIMPESNDRNISFFIKDEYLAQMSEQDISDDLFSNIFKLQDYGYINQYMRLFQKEGFKNLSWQRVYIYKPLNEYLHRLNDEQKIVLAADLNRVENMETRDCFFTRENTESPPVLIDPESDVYKKLQALLSQIRDLDTITVAQFHELQKKLYPKYYPNYKQFLYALAITPLSQRDNLYKYYKKLENN